MINNTDILPAIGTIIVTLGINAGFLLLSARIFNIEGRSYIGAIGIAIAAGLTVYILGFVPKVGIILAPIIGLLVAIIATKLIYKTKLIKAIGAVLLATVIIMAIFYLLGALLSRTYRF